MKKNLYIVLIGLVSMMAILHACKHQPDVIPPDPPFIGGNGNPDPPIIDPEEICDPDSVYYIQDVLPIILRSCALPNPNDQSMTCHHAGHEDDLNFHLFNVFMEEALDGKVHEVLTDTDPDDHMPPYSEPQLSNDELQAIFTWIQQGAQYNSCEGCDTTVVTYSGTIQPMLAFNCTGGCHTGANPTGGLDLTQYSVVQTVANNGRLEGAVKHLPGFTPMPYSTTASFQLSQCKIDQIMNWIGQGAPNN